MNYLGNAKIKYYFFILQWTDNPVLLKQEWFLIRILMGESSLEVTRVHLALLTRKTENKILLSQLLDEGFTPVDINLLEYFSNETLCIIVI